MRRSLAGEHRVRAESDRRWATHVMCQYPEATLLLAEEHERAARLIEADPSQLIAAIRDCDRIARDEGSAVDGILRRLREAAESYFGGDFGKETK